ncbi:MAG TPA: hypothetical protein VLH56_19575 [Dissulfurispiraceae bacterium]|nr:hypothetical protein [Dissulfurispiraceae bacterium]
MNHPSIKDNSVPYFAWRRVRVLKAIEVVSFSIEAPLVYIITQVYGKWDTNNALGAFSPVVFARFTQTESQYCDKPIPVELLGSPGCRRVNDVVDVSATQADGGGLGAAFLSTPKFDIPDLRIPVRMRGVFQVELSGMEINSDVNPFANRPSFIDLFLTGRLYKERADENA